MQIQMLARSMGLSWKLPLLAALCLAPVLGAATLTSSDGKTREFPVVVSAAPAGLTVRESPAGRDIVIPWSRLDAAKSAEANEWFEEARTKAAAGETVALNLGLPEPVRPEPARPSEPAAPQAEWRSEKLTVEGGNGKNFNRLSLSAYVHREVAVPRLALVWVGSPSPLAKRGDAADMARRMQGALVVADFEGADAQTAEGSGQALVSGVADLLRQTRVPTDRGPGQAAAPSAVATGLSVGAPVEADEAKDAKDIKDAKDDAKGDKEEEADGEGGAEAAAPGGGAAIILIGSGEGAGFVWNLLCARPQDVVAAVVIDGVLRAEPTAGAFSTPCLFLQSPASAPGDVPSTAVSADMTRPDNVWRYYSTDGCRWCIASPSGDPLALAVAFARDVAAASPYVEAMETLESWQNNKLRHRIPMPVVNAKNYKEQAFRLATPDGRSVFPVASKTGAARNDLVWVPSAAFAARLAGR